MNHLTLEFLNSLICEEFAAVMLTCKCSKVVNIVYKCVGTMSEINQLRLALQESSTARNVAEGQCISLKVGIFNKFFISMATFICHLLVAYKICCCHADLA